MKLIANVQRIQDVTLFYLDAIQANPIYAQNTRKRSSGILLTVEAVGQMPTAIETPIAETESVLHCPFFLKAAVIVAENASGPLSAAPRTKLAECPAGTILIVSKIINGGKRRRVVKKEGNFWPRTRG